MSSLFVLLLIQFIVIITAVPNLSRKCKLSDSKCLTAVAQEVLPTVAAGMPDIGTEPLDVMYIDKNKIDLAGLKLDFKDTYVKDLKNAIIKSVSFNMEKKIMKLKFKTDIEVKSKYKASGQMLVLPISGDGNMTLYLKHTDMEVTIPFQIVKNQNGKDILELKSYRFKYDVVGGIRINFTNLFNGNKTLSDTMLKFMNDSWKILSIEFGRPMFDEVLKKIFAAMKTYLRSQPLQDFFDI